MRLALQGFGLALARWSLAGDDIAAGHLVVASDKPLSYFRTYWLLHSKHGREHPAFAQFRDLARGRDGSVPAPAGALMSRRGCAPESPVQ